MAERFTATAAGLAAADHPQAWYLGCLKGRGDGHALYPAAGLGPRTWAPPRDCPWSIGLMDGGLLKNGKVPDIVDGRVHWTCALADWHAFFWWDRSGDSRPNSCSGFYVRGLPLGSIATGDVFSRALVAFDFAQSQFPEIVRRQRSPLVLVESTR